MELKDLQQMMIHVADGIISKVDVLTEADKLGDADHGTGMENGFSNLKKNITGKEFQDTSSLFSTCGNSIMMSSGGASGIIFGTLFKAGGKSLQNKNTFETDDFIALLENGLDGIKKRGGAKAGDKTMIDALEPAATEAKKHSDKPLVFVVEKAFKAAFEGSENTKNMVAASGRMKTLGDRTKGFPDPGSITMYLILSYMDDFIKKVKKS